MGSGRIEELKKCLLCAHNEYVMRYRCWNLKKKNIIKHGFITFFISFKLTPAKCFLQNERCIEIHLSLLVLDHLNWTIQ